jgi:hypothetical protein
MVRNIKVIDESESGRNLSFYDPKRNTTMTRQEFVQEIRKGNYEDYHVRIINRVATPVSNPDGKEGNNLD